MLHSTLHSVLFVLIGAKSLEMFAACEFAFSSEPDDFPMAVISLSYMDPVTAVMVREKGNIGRFGQGNFKDVKGVVAHIVNSNHRSGKVCDHFDKDQIPHEPYIALIKQGLCKDEVNIMNAAEANASAVIMYGAYMDANLVKISFGVLQMPYVFVSPEKGQQIASLVDNGTRVMACIGIEKRSGFRYASVNRTSVLFVSISFIFLMVLSMAWLIFYYFQKFRFVVAKDVLSKRLCSAAKKALDKIPARTLQTSDFHSDFEGECCAVCIETLKAGEMVRVLPCKHRFHKICVDPWLLEQRSCPMCKLDILRHFGLIYTGSQESVFEIDEPQVQHRNSFRDTVPIVMRRNSYCQTDPPMEDRSTSPMHPHFAECHVMIPVATPSISADSCVSDIAVSVSESGALKEEEHKNGNIFQE